MDTLVIVLFVCIVVMACVVGLIGLSWIMDKLILKPGPNGDISMTAVKSTASNRTIVDIE